MNITREYALMQGYTIDDHSSPPVAYKGPRFSPTVWATTYTERETILIAAMKTAAAKLQSYNVTQKSYDIGRELYTALKEAGVDVD